MGWTIFWIVVIFAIGGLAYLYNAGSDQLEAHRADIDAKAQANREAFESDRAKYIADHFGTEPWFYSDDQTEKAIGEVPGGIRIASWKTPPSHFIGTGVDFSEGMKFAPEKDVIVNFRDIVDVTVTQDDVIETYTRTVSTPVSVAKKKSSIGRALVGGVLLGPAGAVVGAVSGAATTSQIKTVVTKQQDTRVVAGPPTLTITLSGKPYTFERVTFATMDEARSWGLWLADQRVG
ncbi:hypothetical protein [Brevundimonas sp. SGAir0440]|uniref:hypothetical protein n=1 Tax=Brevundimonas sp. SGAir0440 TaxID=2579977 RepID=UPI0010CCC6B1|nr:hypothetical protein [Brevundimonas sp. SGAir0440]QCQ98501.1 hypothetical protein E7T10_07390 [Brevundimonas sp. SGAir0440]